MRENFSNISYCFNLSNFFITLDKNIIIVQISVATGKYKNVILVQEYTQTGGYILFSSIPPMSCFHGVENM